MFCFVKTIQSTYGHHLLHWVFLIKATLDEVMFYRFLYMFLFRTNGFVSPIRSNRNVSNGDSSAFLIIVFITSGFDGGKKLMTQNGHICVTLWEIH